MPKRIADEERYYIDSNGCWIYKMSIAPSTGYGQYSLYLGKGNYKNISAHQYFYEKFITKVPEGFELDHLCRVRACCNPEHLEVVTCQENIQRGLVSKLNKDKVLAIRKLYHNGLNQKTLAKKFSLNQSTISRITNGLRWSNIQLYA